MSSAIYSSDELNSDAAREFGCSPSFCAYTGQPFTIPCAENSNLRSFGFHIHVGFKSTDFNSFDIEDVEKFIKYCDLYAGLPSICVDRDNRRRELYGKAGDYRVKQVDDIIVVEYRTLGGALLTNPASIYWALKNIQKAIIAFNENAELPDGEAIQNIINNSLYKEAVELCNKFKIEVPLFFIENGFFQKSKINANSSSVRQLTSGIW